MSDMSEKIAQWLSVGQRKVVGSNSNHEHVLNQSRYVRYVSEDSSVAKRWTTEGRGFKLLTIKPIITVL